MFKNAVKLGMGLAIGYHLGNIIVNAVSKAFVEGFGDPYLIKHAKKGSERAKKYCDKWGLDYSEPKEFDDEMKECSPEEESKENVKEEKNGLCEDCKCSENLSEKMKKILNDCDDNMNAAHSDLIEHMKKLMTLNYSGTEDE